MPRITVDGVELEVAEGRTILQALDDLGLLMNGVDVPHYCWHPKLSVDGSCRLCQVEVEGIPKLQIACNTPAADGMVIHTTSERVRRAREGVMELLLVNHPLDCPICDQAGECKLQDYAFEYGVAHGRSVEPRRAGRKRVELGPTIVFDEERCILCRRCVRFCREVPGTGELAVRERGDRSTIATFPGQELDNDYSMNVADVCPVGALTTRDFRFRIRVWFLEDVPGVCTGCARGCNVHLGVANNRVYRYVPRRNDRVNGTWICDAGRLSYKRIGAEDRITAAWVRGEDGVRQELAVDAALGVAAERLRRVIETHGAGAVGGLASPHATNEDLLVLRRLLAALGSTQSGFALARGAADDLLLHAEKAANAEGARRLGFGDAAPLLERLRGGAVEALLVLGHDLLDPAYRAGLDALREIDTVVLLDTHHSEIETVAHVVIPTRHAAEKHGTLTNADGLVQRVVPAVTPAFDARDEGAVLWQLGAALGLEGFAEPWDAQGLARELDAAAPAAEGA
ncbi:MAG: 2Fe-2S iron-sulfur cluster-binding protein [Myxococcota bacterium]|nr:2Fe-2S iron-sulfur cluster-binding protein [Myxococcota bacterium]